MITLTIHGKPVTIKNEPIKVGQVLNFNAINSALKPVNLEQFKGNKKIISSVPSIDTKTCAQQTKNFNEKAAKLTNMVVITISKDLPFAQSRFCEALKLNKNFHIWSDYQCSKSNFSNTTNLIIDENQLLARAVMVVDENNQVLYCQIVNEVTKEPNYEEVLNFIATLN